MQTEVLDNPAHSRFELTVGDNVAFVDYERSGDRTVLTHTEVPEALSGRGIGSKLVRGTLEALRAQGRTAVSRCSFVTAYAERHPEYRDVVTDGEV